MQNKEKYYILVDESGDFKVKNDVLSFVGAFISKVHPDKITAEFKNTLQYFNKKYPQAKLEPKDIHATEILKPDRYQIDTSIIQCREQIKEEFLLAFKNLLEKYGVYYFKASFDKNQQFKTAQINSDIEEGHISANISNAPMQLKYALCLVGLFERIKDKMQNEDLYFYISRRHSVVINKINDDKRSWEDYHNSLETAIQKEFSLKAKINKGDFKLFTSIADICCYYLRDLSLSKSKIIERKPTQKSYDFVTKSTKEFIDIAMQNKQYASIYGLVDNKKQQKIINKLTELNKEEKSKQFPYFIKIANEYIENRDLQKAQNIFDAIKEQSKDIDSLDLYEKATDGLLKCTNHSGKINEQENILKDLKDTLGEQPKLSHVYKYQKILEYENRALNGYFNNYAFEEVLHFKDKVEEYESIIDLISQSDKSANKCYLLHKMQSSIAQSYAFISSYDKEDYFDKAKSQFEKVLSNFDKSIDDRSINYLAIFYCYHKDFESAREILKVHRDIEPNANNILEKIKEAINKSKPNLFDILVLLKSSQDFLKDNKAQCNKIYNYLTAHLKEKDYKEHPKQLICKTLTYLLMGHGLYKEAKNILEVAQNINKNFATETTLLPCLALQALCYKSLKKQKDFEDTEDKLFDELSKLMSYSKYFKSYIEKIGGIQKIKDDLAKNDIDNISHWMPCFYS